LKQKVKGVPVGNAGKTESPAKTKKKKKKKKKRTKSNYREETIVNLGDGDI